MEGEEAVPAQDSASPAPRTSAESEPDERESEEAVAESVPPPPPPPATDASSFMTRLKALKPDLDKVLAANVSVSQELKTRAGELGTLARNKQFGEASQLLALVEQLVQQGLQEMGVSQGTSSTPGLAMFDAIKLVAANHAWKQARDRALDGMQQLEGALRRTQDEVAEAIADVIVGLAADFPPHVGHDARPIGPGGPQGRRPGLQAIAERRPAGNQRLPGLPENARREIHGLRGKRVRSRDQGPRTAEGSLA